MKHCDRIIHVFVLSLVLGISSAICVAQDVRGTYNLYGSGGKLVGTMTVNGQNGSSFTIGGTGWSGSGSVSNGSGYYTWKFTDGRSGRTDIRATASQGITQGTVLGPSGDRSLNWTYTATRTSAPPRPAAGGACVSSVKPTEPDSDGQWYVAVSNNCDYAVQVTIRNGGVPYGVYMPSTMKRARQAIGMEGPKPDFNVSWVKAP